MREVRGVEGNGEWRAIGFRMAQTLSVSSLELISPGALLTPCILDDDPAQLELMTELVASAGFEAVATTDPEEGLAQTAEWYRKKGWISTS